MRNLVVCFGVIFAVVVLVASPTISFGQSHAISQRAVIYIETKCRTSGGDSITQKGSGFIISEDGYVVTAFHVVGCLGKNGSTLTREGIKGSIGSIHAPSPRTLQLIRSDEQADVAILKFPGMLGEEYAHLKACRLGTPQTQSSFKVAGFPSGLDFQTMRGEIGNTNAGGGRWAASSAFNSGMSGGPVVQDGFVVGIIKGGVGNNASIRTVTPLSLARSVIEGAGVDLRECAKYYKPKMNFRDCPTCPEMVVIPAGNFQMGSPKGEKFDGGNEERPAHPVTIAKPFAVSKFEVTFDDWDACIADNKCSTWTDPITGLPRDMNWGRGRRPIMNISWNDITTQYLPWLSKKTGTNYRLLTEAEWEYAALAGSNTAYSWGQVINKYFAHYNYQYILDDIEWDKVVLSHPAPDRTLKVGSKLGNRFGLFDMIGNVREWVQDCYTNSYINAPNDGTKGVETARCMRVQRGGGWSDRIRYARTAGRQKAHAEIIRWNVTGFRVARDLP